MAISRTVDHGRIFRRSSRGAVRAKASGSQSYEKQSYRSRTLVAEKLPLNLHPRRSYESFLQFKSDPEFLPYCSMMNHWQ
jgi:hypothetical protein